MAIKVLRTKQSNQTLDTTKANDTYFDINATPEKEYDLDKISVDKDRASSDSPLFVKVEDSGVSTRNPGSVSICNCESKKTTTSVDYSKYLLNDIPDSTGCCNAVPRTPLIIWKDGTIDSGSSKTLDRIEECEEQMSEYINDINKFKIRITRLENRIN